MLAALRAKEVRAVEVVQEAVEVVQEVRVVEVVQEARAVEEAQAQVLALAPLRRSV